MSKPVSNTRGRMSLNEAAATMKRTNATKPAKSAAQANADAARKAAIARGKRK